MKPTPELQLLRQLWIMADIEGREIVRDADADCYNQWKAAVDGLPFWPVDAPWRGSDFVDG